MFFRANPTVSNGVPCDAARRYRSALYAQKYIAKRFWKTTGPTCPFNFSRVHHRGRTDENSLEPGRGRAGRARVRGRAHRRRGRARRVGRQVSDDQRRRGGRPAGGAGPGRRPAVRAGRRGQRTVFERHRFGPRLRVSPLRVLPNASRRCRIPPLRFKRNSIHRKPDNVNSPEF